MCPDDSLCGDPGTDDAVSDSFYARHLEGTTGYLVHDWQFVYNL